MANISPQKRKEIKIFSNEFMAGYIKSINQKRNQCKQVGHLSETRLGNNGIETTIYCSHCNTMYTEPLNEEERNWGNNMSKAIFV